MRSSSPGVPPLRILVVENHPDTRKYLQMYLEQLGHRVESVGSMTEALAAAPSSDCQVLISDIGLPDGDGWELLSRAEFPRPIYAIAMSGFGVDTDCQKSLGAGFRHHMVKPFVLDDLDDMLMEAARELSVC